MISAHDALIYVMVITAAADREMSDAEIQTMGDTVRHLPAFQSFDVEQLPRAAGNCAELLTQEDGLETILDLCKAALSPSLRETAYVLAVDIAASDLQTAQEELRVLELIRHRFELDRLVAAAIERGARARFHQID